MEKGEYLQHFIDNPPPCKKPQQIVRITLNCLSEKLKKIVSTHFIQSPFQISEAMFIYLTIYECIHEYHEYIQHPSNNFHSNLIHSTV